LLEEPDNAAMSAAWYGETRGCNELADEGDYRRLTRRINGGLNGYEDRVARMQRALEAFDCA
jgi:putative chitinase